MSQRRQHSPAVYRRRRLVAALAAVGLLAALVWGVRGMVDLFDSDHETPAEAGEAEAGDGEDTDSGSPDSDANGEGADSAAEVPEGHCPPGDVAVRAGTHSDSYASDEAPLLIMEVENTGEESCTIDVGTGEQVFQVSHEGRELFSTEQCDTSEDSHELEFEPGQSERAELTWPRSDSSVDCTEATELSSGDYEVTVAVSGVTSEPASFTLDGVED